VDRVDLDDNQGATFVEHVRDLVADVAARAPRGSVTRSDAATGKEVRTHS
jgi:hypothetical protein